ncbi:MAG: PIN domain-containing protein [Ferruginibacter sp.]|nr:PIN domain-containing protein [Ferruginibacter sp.]
MTSKSPYHNIYKALVKGHFELAITNEILLEYQEVMQEKYGLVTANSFIALLIELPNVKFINTYYYWSLIANDPDDNKYCDCAIAGKAKYLVTEDKHFQILKTIPFPLLETISIDRFSAFLDFQL